MESRDLVDQNKLIHRDEKGVEYSYDELLPHIKEYGKYQIIMQVRDRLPLS